MKYSKERVSDFLEACKKGETPTQIASQWGILVEELQEWSKDPKFKKTWQLGKEAFQAYHETLLARMTDKTRLDYLPKVANSEINAQIYRLKVLFKEQWSEKVDPSTIIQTNNCFSGTPEELDKQINHLLSSITKANPAILPTIKSDTDERKTH